MFSLSEDKCGFYFSCVNGLEDLYNHQQPGSTMFLLVKYSRMAGGEKEKMDGSWC
jgi:hypothetical protein